MVVIMGLRRFVWSSAKIINILNIVLIMGFFGSKWEVGETPMDVEKREMMLDSFDAVDDLKEAVNTNCFAIEKQRRLLEMMNERDKKKYRNK